MVVKNSIFSGKPRWPWRITMLWMGQLTISTGPFPSPLANSDLYHCEIAQQQWVVLRLPFSDGLFMTLLYPHYIVIWKRPVYRWFTYETWWFHQHFGNWSAASHCSSPLGFEAPPWPGAGATSRGGTLGQHGANQGASSWWTNGWGWWGLVGRWWKIHHDSSWFIVIHPFPWFFFKTDPERKKAWWFSREVPRWDHAIGVFAIRVMGLQSEIQGNDEWT